MCVCAYVCARTCALITQLCLTLCDTMDCSLPGSSVHRILQARILQFIAIPFSSRSSQTRDRTWVSCIAGRFFTIRATREALIVRLEEEMLKGYSVLDGLCRDCALLFPAHQHPQEHPEPGPATPTHWAASARPPSAGTDSGPGATSLVLGDRLSLRHWSQPAGPVPGQAGGHASCTGRSAAGQPSQRTRRPTP